MPRDNWFERNPRKAKWLVGLLCVLFIEMIIRGLVGLDLLPYERYPTASEFSFAGDVDPDFGRWRVPNASYRHQQKCIDVEYTTNSVGARDIERTKASTAKRRVFVLGDSFAAALGVENDARASSLLEKMTLVA